MTRAKSKSSLKHRKVKASARGFKDARRKRVKGAKEALLHQGQYAYIGRKQKKRNLRSLWIIRLNAAVREHGISYSRFISALKNKKIEIDRKVLAEIAVTDAEGFEAVVKKALAK